MQRYKGERGSKNMKVNCRRGERVRVFGFSCVGGFVKVCDRKFEMCAHINPHLCVLLYFGLAGNCEGFLHVY